MSRLLSKEQKGAAREAFAGGAAGQYDDDDSYDSNNSLEEDEDEDELPWITWFCQLKGNEFFCEIDDEYVQDEFNLTGLPGMVPFYDNAVDMILDLESPGQDQLTDEQAHIVESAAETLYGLIHARFITTARGLKLMEQKYLNADFGRCPRVFCGGQPVLPVGQSDIVRESSVKVYCPKCGDIFYPRSSRHKQLDGAFWGTTFPHLLLLTIFNGPPPHERPSQKYVPRIFGFRVRKPAEVDPSIYQAGSADEDTPLAAPPAAAAIAVGSPIPATAGTPNSGAARGRPTSAPASRP